jgi:hypothetical protein
VTVLALLCGSASILIAQPQTTSIWPSGKAYFFRGSQYFRYDPKLDHVDPGYPVPIAGHWPGFPSDFEEGVDAEVVWPNGKVYFFKGNQYLRYDIASDQVDGGPAPIAANWRGLWADGIDAGVVWPNGKAYFFKGAQYIRYDIASDKADVGYPKPIQGNWPGFPAGFITGVDDAVVWNNGKAYFFRGGEYIRYDIAADKTDGGYPQAVAQNWPGLVGNLTADAKGTCTQGCQTECGPIGGEGKAEWVGCMKKCTAECNKRVIPVCENSSGTLLPKYYVLGLLYAPPGCSNTSILKCNAQSSVDYQDGSSMGTKMSVDKSFKAGIDLKTDISFTIPFDYVKFTEDIGASAGFTNTASDSNSQTITKGQTLDIKAAGNGDGIDHSQDAFILLLNPAIAVQESQKVVNGACGPTVVNWNIGLSGSPGVQERYLVYVQWLKDPASMPPNVAQQLQALGFTDEDFRTILALDPFANGSSAMDPDPARFAPTTSSFFYEPPLQESSCNNGVCSCWALQDSIKNQLQTDNMSAFQTEYSVGLSYNVKVADLFDKLATAGGSIEDRFTWTSKSTESDITDSTQVATAAIVCPSTLYKAPETLMYVYWDKLFGSFLFVPTAVTSPRFTMLSQGKASGPNGEPLAHEPITLSVSGKTYHTWTNNHGEYFFLGSNTISGLNLPTGMLSIRGRAQEVALGSADQLQLRVQ